jgi:hypothetical protein
MASFRNTRAGETPCSRFGTTSGVNPGRQHGAVPSCLTCRRTDFRVLCRSLVLLKRTPRGQLPRRMTFAAQRGSDSVRIRLTSRIRCADAPNEGTSASARECPRVTAVYELDKPMARFAGVSAKPSDGLEPSTPSLPWRFSAQAWGGPTWREVASHLAFGPFANWRLTLFADFGFPAFGH